MLSVRSHTKFLSFGKGLKVLKNQISPPNPPKKIGCLHERKPKNCGSFCREG